MHSNVQGPLEALISRINTQDAREGFQCAATACSKDIQHQMCMQVLILCPNLDDSDMVNGQMLEVEVGSLTDSIGELKSRLADVVGIGANKQKLTREPIGVMQDQQSLAFYNVAPDVQLQLGISKRGGKRK